MKRLDGFSEYTQKELMIVLFELVYLMYHLMSDDKRCQAFLDKWLPVMWKDRQHEVKVHEELKGMTVDQLSTRLNEDGEILRQKSPEMGAETIEMFREMQDLLKVITLRPTSSTG